MSESLPPSSTLLLTRYTSLNKKREWANRSFFLNLQKKYQKIWFYSQIFLSEPLVFCEQKSKWAICSKKRAICSFGHLSWVTWANRSQSLYFHERPGRFAHSRSLVLSDLSEWLTVAHFIWAIWANEQMSDERIPNPVYFKLLDIIHNWGYQ